MTLLLFIAAIAVSAFLAGLVGFAFGQGQQRAAARQTIRRLQDTQTHYARMLTAAHPAPATAPLSDWSREDLDDTPARPRAESIH